MGLYGPFFFTILNTQVGEYKWRRNHWVQVLYLMLRLKKELVRVAKIKSLKPVQ